MARKTNFNREMSNFYRAQKRAGKKDYEIAESMGMSASQFSRIKNKKATVSARKQNEFRAITTTDDNYSITGAELQDLTTSSNARTAREAARALDKLQNALNTSDADRIANAETSRPTVYRTTKDGKRVGVLLGRSKQEEQREEVRRQLIAQGVNPDRVDEYYNEALQISAGN
jgi:transcriptional regulator with XRE-family HTH domain